MRRESWNGSWRRIGVCRLPAGATPDNGISREWAPPPRKGGFPKSLPRRPGLALALGVVLSGLTGLNLPAQTTLSQYPGFVGQDVGAPEFPGSITLVSTNVGGTTITNALWVTAGGHDIWDNGDDFYYFYTNKTGGFDARVRVLDLQGNNTWAKAELMARAPNDPTSPAPDTGDPHVSNMTTRTGGQNGVMDQWRTSRGGGSSWPGGFTSVNTSQFTPQYPNIWLRLQRVGDVFTSSASHDGTNWTVLDIHDTSANPLPATVMVGLATTSHDRGSTAYAVYSDLVFVAPPPDIVNILPRNHTSYLPANTNLSFLVNSLVGVNSTGISLVVNGVDQTANLKITGTVNAQNVTYNGPFQTNQFYSFVAKAVDLSGKSATVSFAWDTLSDANFTIEAEDFNFGGGQYIDNPVLASSAAANNYIDRAGVANVDEYDPTEGSANHAYRTYDANAGTGEMVGTEPNGDVPRSAYLKAQQGDAAIVDYDVGWVDVGEWWNYTRTFPAGKFQIYARLAYPGTSFAATLDQVISSASAANQVTARLGGFAGPGTGAWQTYAFFPLQDIFGNTVTLPMSGVETLRFRTVAGGLNANFYMFLPATSAQTLAPYVSSVSPAPGATGVNPAAVISATIINRDTQVDTGSVKLSVNGTSVTPTVTANSAGAFVSYAAPSLYPLGSTNTVQLVYQDKSAAAATNQWSFVVIAASSVGFTMPVSYALPADSGQTPGWSVRVIQIDQGAAQVNSTAWSEGILAGQYGVVASGSDTPQVINYWGNGGRGNFGNDAEFTATFNLVGGNNFAMEAIGYVALNAGVYRFGVNSDDGFRVTTGQYAHQLVTMSGAEYNGGRGVGNTEWRFLAPTNGLYPIRLSYEEGGGGYACEFYSRDDSGTRHLIGDPSDPAALKVYRFSSVLTNNPIVITQPPTNVTVAANSPLTLSISATTTVDNASLLLYEWTLSGQHVAYGKSFTIPYAQTSDAGTYTCTIAYLGYQQAQGKATATVTVTADVTPPTVRQISGAASLANVVITFDAPVDATTAGTVGNYAIDGGLTVTGASLNADGTKVTLSTGAQTAGKTYNVTINGVKDTAGNLIAANTKLHFSGFVLASGVVLAEFFDNIGGTAVSALTGDASYQNNQPTRVYGFTSFTDPTWENGDNYGQRMTALITPPTTGNYIFWIASDDNSELWLSTDDNPANVKLIAAETAWSNQNQFNTSGGNSDLPSKRSDQYTSTQWPTGNTISLTAGKQYYLMALQKEGGGGDGVAVAWTLPGQSASTINVIPRSAVASYVNPDVASLSITQQPPATVTTLENRSVTLTVGATGAWQFGTTVNYQWQKNGADISGANRFYYTTPPLTTGDSGAQFQCVVSVPALSTNSSATTVTVNKDTAAPNVLSAGALPGASAVGVLFDEVVDATSASTAANYTVTGANVTSAVQQSYGSFVLLTLDKPVAANASVTVKNVMDLAGNAQNSSSASVVLSTLADEDIAGKDPNGNTDPLVPGATYPAGANAFIMKAGGHDIWDASDGAHFIYQSVQGDFDAKVHVMDIIRANSWSKAALTAREDLDGPGRHVDILTTATTGQNVINMQWRDTRGGSSASLAGALRPTPVPYPNAWIRLQRVGNTFNSFWGFDGNNWMFLTSYTPSTPFTNALYVGLATTAHDNGGTNTVALYQDYLVTTGSAPPPGVKLSITKSGSNVTIAWPTTAGLTLQQAGSLAAPITWSPVPQTPTTSGSTSSVTLPIGASTQFFILKQ